ncbi:hypothetical protein Y032_0071g551 [Ancylostoma ceylanicum]|nr:hypothetical protein Y032_0071g551 [Ancylostoma ceylanicum]
MQKRSYIRFLTSWRFRLLGGISTIETTLFRPSARTPCDSSKRETDPTEHVTPNTARVTVLGDFRLSENALSVLELGPSFSPSQPISTLVLRKITCALHQLQNKLRRRANFDCELVDRKTSQVYPAIPFPKPFFKQQAANPSVDVSFRLFADEVYKVLARQKQRRDSSNLSFAQKEGIKQLRELVQSSEIRLSTSDKGGEFVVIPHQLDVAITERHLQDASLYRASSAGEFLTQYRKLNREWVSVAKSAGLDPTAIARLKIDLPVCPVLYLLIKTHKFQASNDLKSNDPSAFKVRPIVSCVGGPTDRIGWFLNTIIGQLLNYIPAHLTNTQMFLNRLRTTKITENCVVESFDVNALYTNVSNDSAMQAIFELLSEHAGTINLYGFSVSGVMLLLKACLDCNVFRWYGKYFAQIRGLAMGQRLAPTLAIAFMAKIEQPALEYRPLLYCRYIDDCFVICATQAEMDKCFHLMNEQSEHIRLTRDKPINGWLPFLNVQVKMTKGVYWTKWYRKPSSKNILVHFLSAHPTHLKRAVVTNMFRTATKVCSGLAEKEESLVLARQIAASNGYESYISMSKRRREALARKRDPNTTDKIPFYLPFISDEVSTAIRQCLRRSALNKVVSIVEIPPSNLKRQLVRNRMYDRFCITPNCVVCPTGRPGDCMCSGVIYLITCIGCGAEYIGETSRPLCARIREHMDGKGRSRLTTPLGSHRKFQHDGENFEVNVKILAQEPETSARKFLEALWIHAKSPKMNRKEECLSMTRELAPYLDLLF